MKIGILTFHCAHNYGAVLQCYALQETLKSMGHDVKVIDYRPEYLLAPYRWFSISRFRRRNPLKMLKACLIESFLLVARIKRYNAFQTFIYSRLNLSPKVKGKSVPSSYDTYIMGSDQIWNPKITRGFDPVYFGCFDFEKGKRKYISYAASMEACKLNDAAEMYYKNALQKFDAVSVREKQLEELLQPLTEKSIELVLDPTLLANKELWDAIAQRPKTNRKYVLVYQVRSNTNTIRIAQQLAKSVDAEVVEVASYLTLSLSKNRKQCGSPEKFLGWIKNAHCVVTTSFHGTAFSIIFNRPFYCIKLDDGSDTRSESLLRSLNLDDRMIGKEDLPTFSHVDYTKVNLKLKELRKKSLEFLKASIKQ